MAKCERCGRSGLFLKLSDGLCDNCQSTLRMEREQAELSQKIAALKAELSDLDGLRQTAVSETIAAAMGAAQVEAEKITDAAAQQVANLRSDVERQLSESRGSLDSLGCQITAKREELQELLDQVIETRETVLLQSYGLYTPRYNFTKADEYKARLLEIRAKQKDMVKAKTAATGSSEWTVNNSAAQGRKLIADMQKLLLRAFNAECDDAVEHVRYSNLSASEKRITTSRDAISKLGSMMGISISPVYYRLKIEELYLAFEYAQKKEAEKEAQKEARAQMREAAKLAREIEEARKNLEKEQKHYKNALKKITSQLASAPASERAAIEERKGQIEEQLRKIDKEFADVDYREANQRAGYVYVISNIGAFGEGVYKIGMTRRLDPMDRVDELGDASVPFDFDVHAMIFSDDAPKLEAALHNAFADRKVNFVNQRREFFRVPLDEIKRVIRENYDKTVEFTDIPAAEQYRQSVLLREQLKAEKEAI